MGSDRVQVSGSVVPGVSAPANKMLKSSALMWSLASGFSSGVLASRNLVTIVKSGSIENWKHACCHRAHKQDSLTSAGGPLDYC
jgi:hypothetical protein